ncbi:map kinase [Schizopora paradoxa]|uniref:Map kinase n=1 Tax=Schizopora paradoxa TaxID=27342 RepID=A0A0H2S771_9AGAM|nr:map kinase [Schizopora paradoxa]
MMGFGTFEVPINYEDFRAIGVGSVGRVCSALDEISGSHFAVKKVKDTFKSSGLAQRTYREIRMLKEFDHDNILKLHNVFISPSDEVYIVTDLMHFSLEEIMKGTSLDKEDIQYFIYQILRGLKYIHSAEIAHRDLKPGNILVDKEGHLKVCDFGMARVKDPKMTAYVTTRWYRAPEIILKHGEYGVEVDLFSLGCIFAEMLEQDPVHPLFESKDGRNHYYLIAELLGSPPKELTEGTHLAGLFREAPESRRRPKKFAERFKSQDACARDLLEKLLRWVPSERISAERALEHEFVQPFRDVDGETALPGRFDDPNSGADLSPNQWRDVIIREIRDFHKRRTRFS